jgi:PST family polysaccharide transporter
VRLAGTIAYSTVATGVSVAGGLLRNKIFATFLSLNLFGILATGQQSVALLGAVFAFGLPLGITTFAARLPTATRADRIVAVSRIVVLAMSAALAAALVLVAALAVDAALIARAITARGDLTLPVSILLLSTPFVVAESCLFALLEGMGRVRDIVRFRTVPVLIALPLYYALAASFGLTGVAAGILLNEALLTAYGLYLNRDLIALREETFRLGDVAGAILKVGAMSMAVGATWLLADFLVKRYLLATLGEASNAVIQSVARITDLYPTLALGWLTLHLFPLVAASTGDRAAVAAAVERTLMVAVALVVPVIVALFACRELVLEIAYTRDFAVAVAYFGVMLGTGIPKVVAWVLGIALLPMGWRRQWVYASGLYIVTYVGGVAGGLALALGMYAIPLGAGVAWAVQSAYTAVLFRRRGVPLSAALGWYGAGFAALTILVVAATWWLPLLGAAVLLYAGMMHRYGAFRELRDHWRALREPRAA